MTSISVRKRASDYHAELTGTPRAWESGKTEAEAIGKLILSFQKESSVKVIRYDNNSSSENPIAIVWAYHNAAAANCFCIDCITQRARERGLLQVGG